VAHDNINKCKTGHKDTTHIVVSVCIFAKIKDYHLKICISITFSTGKNMKLL
jgi:hypothetical protein